jgi:XTP/dITP diphosphohydrolase
MSKLLLATRNKGKLSELTAFLADLPIFLVSLDDLNIKLEVEENGDTYEENARKKALFYAKLSSLPTLADDGGLEIAALGGAPGVKSRRWLGQESTDAQLISHMKKVARSLPETNRKSRFVVSLAFALPDGRVWTRRASVNGIIAKTPYPKLLKGYPFRSFFFLPGVKKYYHENELSEEEMKKFNHRYRAVQKIIPIVQKALLLY